MIETESSEKKSEHQSEHQSEYQNEGIGFPEEKRLNEETQFSEAKRFAEENYRLEHSEEASSDPEDQPQSLSSDSSGKKKKEKKGFCRNPKFYAVIAALILIAAGILSCTVIVPMVKKNRKLDTSHKYSNTSQISDSGTDLSGVKLQADLFASDLCVSEDPVINDNISIDDETEGDLLVNLETGSSVYAKNIYTRLYPASITKVMTAILVMEYGNMDQTVVMQDSDFVLEEGAQTSGLVTGDQLTVEQLLQILLVYSANDAAMALSRTIGGSTEEFVSMMNTEAQGLGMTGTHFMNPHGLHDDNHYTTVYDVYLMLNRAYQFQTFRDIVKQSSYSTSYVHADGSAGSLIWYSTDQYLTEAHPTPDGVTLLGGKTGTTDQAGSCLAIVAQNRYGVPFIAVVLFSYNHTSLYDNMDQLLNRIND